MSGRAIEKKRTQAEKGTPAAGPDMDKVVREIKQKVNLTRASRVESVAPEPVPAPVSAGPIDRVIELAFNPSDDKLREVTIIDRMQGRLLPLLDVINTGWQYTLEVAAFRQDSREYAHVHGRERPLPPNPIDEFIHRTAQWQKSVAGMNLGKIVDLALAEMETRAEEEYPDDADAFKDTTRR